MKSFKGYVDGGFTVAIYKRRQFTIRCKISNDYYIATWHNGRQTCITFYSTDKNEINNLILGYLKDGFRKV